MNEQRLRAIEERQRLASKSPMSERIDSDRYAVDVAALLSEVRRLQTENADLRTTLRGQTVVDTRDTVTLPLAEVRPLVAAVRLIGFDNSWPELSPYAQKTLAACPTAVAVCRENDSE